MPYAKGSNQSRVQIQTRAHWSLLTCLLHQANTPNATQQWKVLIRDKCHSPAAIISHMKATAAPVMCSVPYARSDLTSLPMRTTRTRVTLCTDHAVDPLPRANSVSSFTVQPRCHFHAGVLGSTPLLLHGIVCFLVPLPQHTGNFLRTEPIFVIGTPRVPQTATDTQQAVRWRVDGQMLTTGLALQSDLGEGGSGTELPRS